MRVIGDREWDMLLGLWHLRYLVTDQIFRAWFSERTMQACRTRLSRLAAEGLLNRSPSNDRARRWAWRLGQGGLAALEAKLGRELKPYQELTPQFIPHLVETNDVFMGLNAAGWPWGSLPFDWLGSHRCGLPFEQVMRHPDTGAPVRRNKLLRPDAIVLAKGTGDSAAAKPRVFIELDRSTESISSGTGRTSIVGKLNAYRTFCTGRAPDSRTWYERTFGDRRPYAIAFVVPASNRQSRRKDSIIETVRTERPSMGEVVHCFVAGDSDGVRKLCGIPEAIEGGARAPEEGGARSVTSANPLQPVAPGGHCALTVAQAASLTHLYRVSVEAYRRLRPDSSVRPRFKEAAHAARAALEELRSGGGRPHGSD